MYSLGRQRKEGFCSFAEVIIHRAEYIVLVTVVGVLWNTQLKLELESLAATSVLASLVANEIEKCIYDEARI